MKDINCPICSNQLSVRVARGRKSNKPFIMLKCDKDGRHFRGFITDQDYVNRVLNEHVLRDTGSEGGSVSGDG
ncbi:hypothetical protein ACFLXH_00915 [Chloroflexota bacterium]